jgi:hypothetical protein
MVAMNQNIMPDKYPTFSLYRSYQNNFLNNVAQFMVKIKNKEIIMVIIVLARYWKNKYYYEPKQIPNQLRYGTILLHVSYLL